MIVLFWIAFLLTVAEFIASPVNTLRGSKVHLQRLREVHFPMGFAYALSWIELAAVSSVIAGLWFPTARLVGGIVLAFCFVPILLWAIRAKRAMTDVLGLTFFMVCALITALYKF